MATLWLVSCVLNVAASACRQHTGAVLVALRRRAAIARASRRLADERAGALAVDVGPPVPRAVRSDDAAFVRGRVAPAAARAEHGALLPVQLHDLRRVLRVGVHAARDRRRPRALRLPGRRALVAPRARRDLLRGDRVALLRSRQPGRPERLPYPGAAQQELLHQHRGV